MPKILAALAFVVVLVVVFFTPVFKIKDIVLPQDACFASEDAQKPKGENIFLFSTSKFEKELKEKYSCIKNIKATKIIPARIKIEAAQEEAVAKFENTNFFVTEKGEVVLSGKNNLASLFLENSATPSAGQKITDEKALFAIKIASLIQKSDFSAANIRVVDSQVAAYNPQGVVVVFSPQKDAAEQVDSLQLVLSAAKIDPAKIAKVDLRFDKPVITYK